MERFSQGKSKLAKRSIWFLAAFILAPSVCPVAAQESEPATKESGSYVKQTAVMDTPTAQGAESKRKKPAPESSHKSINSNLENDLNLLYGVELAGWEALPPLCLLVSGNSLLNPEGKQVEVAGDKSAAILIEYGLNDAVLRKFRRSGLILNLDLFHFKTADGAYGAYSTMRRGSSTVLVRGQASSEDENSISFYSGNQLVFLSSNADADEEAKSGLSKLADQISSRLPAAVAPPWMVSSLPPFERLKGSEKYFMGSKSASHYSNAPFVDALLLDRCRGAAHADYRYSRPLAERLRLLLADYGKPELAQEAFNSYTSSMASYGQKTVQKTSNEVVCKMSDSYLMCGIKGPKVYVISGARKKNSPNILARELRW